MVSISGTVHQLLFMLKSTSLPKGNKGFFLGLGQDTRRLSKGEKCMRKAIIWGKFSVNVVLYHFIFA